MDIKVFTPQYEIVNSGCVFLDDGFVEFLIEGLSFRMYISIGPKEGDPRTNPFADFNTERIDGKNIMVIRAYNWNAQTTLVRPINLATIKGKKLFFRFSSLAVKGENERQEFLIYYSWLYEK